MIQIVCDKIMEILNEKIEFFDKVAGLVRPLTIRVGDVDKTFPVSVNTPSNCNPSDYYDLVPDSKKKSVAYFETRGNPMVMPYRKISIINYPIRLVVWYNLNRITQGKYMDGHELALAVLKDYPMKINDLEFGDTGVKKVINTFDQYVFSNELFNKYSYNEVKSQYMLMPYGAFALDFTVQYMFTFCGTSIFSEQTDCDTGSGGHHDY